MGATAGEDDPERARRGREAARRALFGDDADVSSADERDDADRARSASDRDRHYLDERPPHHDRG